MQLKELNYIVALGEERSISRAAERLYMAQSSLSQFLQTYEAELGTTLFVRTSKGIRPTDAGEVFIDNARSILTHYRLVQNALGDMANLKSGRVIFGISSFRGKYLLPEALKKFYDKYPNVQVDIVEDNSMALEERIIEGSVDLALVAQPLTRLTKEVEFLKRDEVYIVTNKEHPVMQAAHKRPGGQSYWLDLKDASSFEFILSDYDSMLGTISRNEFKKAGIKPVAHHTKMTADLAAAMARKGLGLAFTYDSCAETYEDTVYLSIGEKGVFLELALAQPYDTYKSKAAQALRNVIVENFSQSVIER